MNEKNKKSDKKYRHYNDYHFKSVVQKRANGILKFVKIPYKINNIILSELTDLGPKIHRMDFAGDAEKDGEKTCLIRECQTYPPNRRRHTKIFPICILIKSFKKKESRIIHYLYQKNTIHQKRIQNQHRLHIHNAYGFS